MGTDALELWEAEELFDELLDSQDPVEVGPYTFDPSTVLKECDPIAYREGLNDYIDGLIRDGASVRGYNA